MNLSPMDGVMAKLLSSDWHLDGNPSNSYRWDVFKELQAAAWEHDVDEIYLLGDIIDRKDRHSAAFVNQFIHALLATCTALGPRLKKFRIMRGNHDKPLQGPAFWEFINPLHDIIQYISEPTPDGDVLLLPFSPNPMEEWQGLNYADYKAIFIHATVTGAISESGIELEGTKLPLLPRSVKIYSGDVHTPQSVRNITYVGSPHPIKFGDTYDCRMLVLDDDYNIAHEIQLTPPRKVVGAISSIDDLKRLRVMPGDTLRLVYNLPPDQLDEWGKLETEIAAWAKTSNVALESTEIVVETNKAGDSVNVELLPEESLREFATAEGIDTDLLDVGLALLAESLA
jgi:DNA repair exonuclease SbcCD nuclease subunit